MSQQRQQHSRQGDLQISRTNGAQLTKYRQQGRHRHRLRAAATAGNAAAMPNDDRAQTGVQKALSFVQAQFLPLALLAAMIVG